MTDREAEVDGVVGCQGLEAEGPGPRRHASQPDGWLPMGCIPHPRPNLPRKHVGLRRNRNRNAGVSSWADSKKEKKVASKERTCEL